MPLALGVWYLWGGLLGLIWLICLLSAGVLTWKNDHKVMSSSGSSSRFSGSSEPSGAGPLPTSRACGLKARPLVSNSRFSIRRLGRSGCLNAAASALTS